MYKRQDEERECAEAFLAFIYSKDELETFGLSTLFQTNFFRLFFRYCTGCLLYTSDMVARAKEQKLDPVIGRDDEIRNVVRILSRKTKNNPVLIDEPGIGKTAVVEGLAQRIVCLLYTSRCV